MARLLAIAALVYLVTATHADAPKSRTYDNRLTPITKPQPLLADYPKYVEPINEPSRFESGTLIDDDAADLDVRAWRFSYNAGGIIEVPNRLKAAHTALVVVHPWGIDDGQGWDSPEPAGCAFMCTPQKNKLYHEHVKDVLNPFLTSLRGKVGLIAYSLPGSEDPIRKKLYRSVRGRPSESERGQGAVELTAKLKSFSFKGEPVPSALTLAGANTTREYFKQFPGLDAGARFNNDGFWQLPIPVVKGIDVDPADVIAYDADGYAPLRDFLKKNAIRHVLLAGYATDMCVISTTAGYQNLSKDFNVFIVGDATLATFPAVGTPRHATQAALAFASLNQFITQVSWIKSSR